MALGPTDGQAPDTAKQEEEANRFSWDFLIPPAAYNDFRRRGTFSVDDIQSFAAEIGIAPGTVVGRLQILNGIVSTAMVIAGRVAIQRNSERRQLFVSQHLLSNLMQERGPCIVVQGLPPSADDSLIPGVELIPSS